MARPYDHLSLSPPRCRLLERRPLDVCLSLRAQTLAAAGHRHRRARCKHVYSNANTVQSSLYCCHRFGIVSYDFQRTPKRESAVREYTKKRGRSVEKKNLGSSQHQPVWEGYRTSCLFRDFNCEVLAPFTHAFVPTSHIYNTMFTKRSAPKIATATALLRTRHPEGIQRAVRQGEA